MKRNHGKNQQNLDSTDAAVALRLPNRWPRTLNSKPLDGLKGLLPFYG